MRRLFRFRYPKIVLLIISIVLSYIIFSNPSVAGFVSGLGKWSYIGVFIAGLFFSFGFTTPFSAGFFITLNPANILFATIIASIGAVISDLFIFNFIKSFFMDEFERLEKTKIVKEINHMLTGGLDKRIKLYLLYAFAGFIIAAPLPDEVGIVMLAGFTRIQQHILAAISFVCKFVGILVLLSI